MTRVEFANGVVVNFNGNPTQQDIEEVAQKLGTTPKLAKKKSSVAKTIGQVLVGAEKGVLSTVKGTSSLGERMLQAPYKLAGVKFDNKTSAEKLQSTIEQSAKLKPGSLTEPVGTAQKIGKFAEQVAEFAIPSIKVTRATKLLKPAPKLLTRAATSAGVASVQEGKVGKQSLIAGATELAIPGVSKVVKVATKPVTGIIRRLFTGLGAGLSGASDDTLEIIVKNPKVAKDISKKIINEGQEVVLENNAKTILNGVSKIRKEAGAMYEKGLESLKKTDIKPEVFKKNIKSALNKNGIDINRGVVNLANSDITDEAISKKVVKVIDSITDKSLSDGKSLRDTMKSIEAMKFKTVGSEPNRLAFNALINDISSSIKKSVAESTDKLGEINKAYSSDMALVDGIQSIFGKVQFKNTSELNKVAKKLETLFGQKGLDPKTVDSFLKRININASDFKTSEAVRSIATKTTGANIKGLSIGELIQQVTSSVVTPNAVKNIAIATGLTEKAINTIIKNTSPTIRATIIKGLIEENK